ncbi:hypothetical protein NESM_000933000 [Novymonas esmeraldas]|uniref:Post-SET domain-containing protein n=1 Tax=Novymonas esmeraldas TaxID=1808958 RepID=A0AAW0F2S6_9TRYP
MTIVCADACSLKAKLSAYAPTVLVKPYTTNSASVPPTRSGPMNSRRLKMAKISTHSSIVTTYAAMSNTKFAAQYTKKFSPHRFCRCRDPHCRSFTTHATGFDGRKVNGIITRAPMKMNPSCEFPDGRWNSSAVYRMKAESDLVTYLRKRS